MAGKKSANMRRVPKGGLRQQSCRCWSRSRLASLGYAGPVDLEATIRADLERYWRTRLIDGRGIPGFRYTAALRCAQHYDGIRAGVARKVMRREGRRWGYDIHPGAVIGPGLYLTGHPGGIVVAPGVIAGSGLTLRHGVTIGETGQGQVPTLGDGVYLTAGAKVLGPIMIGSNVAVGANAVVTEDVPDNAIVAGVPA